jgi:putative aldouronate transport system substrate-binding protein
MPRETSSDPRPGLSRRGLIRSAATVAGVAVAGPVLAGCESSNSNGPGTTGKDELSKVVPNYIPSTAVTADIPSVIGANGAVSDPGFLAYPANPVKTVAAVPGKGGTYTTMTPLWGAIPPSSGNGYYDAVNKALGATLKIQPADGNNYGDLLPALFASDKLPDWLQIPGWNTSKLDFGQAVGAKFADLSPYLAGDKAKDYPNLANVATGAWNCGVWNGKLYGIPVYPSGATFNGAYFYRADIFDKHGIKPGDIKTADDLTALGAQLTSQSAGVWAFDDMFGTGAAYACQLFHFPKFWGIDSNGKLIHKYEHPGMVAALEWHAKLVKAGFVHPDAVAANNQNGKQRFWSGKSAICSDGTGAWNGDDAKSGSAANPAYRRMAFSWLTSDASVKPSVELGNGAGMFSYLNKKLSADQIRECLAIANYLAAPYGSAEWLLVNFGAAGAEYNMTGGNPVLTETGSKEVATTFQFLAGPPSPVSVSSGYVQVAKDYCAWQAEAVKSAVKPAFYGMNVTEPSQYSSIGQAVDDTIADVKVGRKPISAYTDAVKTWQTQGGNALRDFYQGIRDKYGTGQ